MAIIFAFSSMHGGGHLPESEVLLRKLGHVAGYLVLTLLLLRALRRSGVAAAVPVAMAAAFAYAVSDEWHQSFVPGRSADVLDWYADAAGALLGAGACWAWGIIRFRADV